LVKNLCRTFVKVSKNRFCQFLITSSLSKFSVIDALGLIDLVNMTFRKVLVSFRQQVDNLGYHFFVFFNQCVLFIVRFFVIKSNKKMGPQNEGWCSQVVVSSRVTIILCIYTCQGTFDWSLVVPDKKYVFFYFSLVLKIWWIAL